MKGLIHFIAHLLGWNGGRVITKIDDNGELWAAFQCGECGEITGKHKTKGFM